MQILFAHGKFHILILWGADIFIFWREFIWPDLDFHRGNIHVWASHISFLLCDWEEKREFYVIIINQIIAL